MVFLYERAIYATVLFPCEHPATTVCFPSLRCIMSMFHSTDCQALLSPSPDSELAVTGSDHTHRPTLSLREDSLLLRVSVYRDCVQCVPGVHTEVHRGTPRYTQVHRGVPGGDTIMSYHCITSLQYSTVQYSTVQYSTELSTVELSADTNRQIEI